MPVAGPLVGLDNGVRGFDKGGLDVDDGFFVCGFEGEGLSRSCWKLIDILGGYQGGFQGFRVLMVVEFFIVR